MSEINLESFEVTGGGISGDLLTEKPQEIRLKVGLLACAYFEYWRMYEGLKEEVQSDMERIAANISKNHDLIYPGLIDTLDKSENAGKLLADEKIDILIITEGTYCTDYLVHQALLHLPSDLKIILYAGQAHKNIDFKAGYDQSLRNSGPMGIVQLTAGFKKMDKYPKFEVVAGPIDDPRVYDKISRFIRVHSTIANLRIWNIGLVGHVYRGMYDFQYDKTSVSGKLGPHVMDVDIKHLQSIFDNISIHDDRVTKLKDMVKTEYSVIDLEDNDILRSARLAVAFKELVNRYKLNGLALLGQHHIEAQMNATCYLGVSELLRQDLALTVTEGDVLGLIMSKILKDFSGITPFFGEWEEIDISLNAIMILGHGFLDPRAARADRKVQVQPACENWGFKGNSLGFQATYEPGPVTLTHIVEDPDGWRMLVGEGEILDTPPLEISESTLIIRMEKEIRQYFEDLLKLGFSHHAIVVPGRFSEDLIMLADQLEIKVCRL
jgi:L-arabinose isomerase